MRIGMRDGAACVARGALGMSCRVSRRLDLREASRGAERVPQQQPAAGGTVESRFTIAPVLELMDP